MDRKQQKTREYFIGKARGRLNKMHFSWPIEFEINDEWWIQSGMTNFRRTRCAYRYPDGATLVKISDIEPLRRSIHVNGFSEERMRRILTGFVEDAEIKPIEVQSSESLPVRIRHPYKLYDGFHRFFASAAAGFEYIPVIVQPFLDLSEL